MYSVCLYIFHSCVLFDWFFSVVRNMETPVTIRGVLIVTIFAVVAHLLVGEFQQRLDADVAVIPPCARPQPVGADVTGGPYTHGAVAADAMECSAIGRDILKKGGSAVDSAIAALNCVELVHGHSTGLAGGFIMTIYNKETGTAQVINARDRAPSGASRDMFGSNNASVRFGGLSVAIPGQVRGLWEAHQRYGKLPWRDLFLPAIQLAEEGVCIGRSMEKAIKKNLEFIKDPKNHLCDVLCDENNNVMGQNMTLKRPQLAKTLRAIADGGADAFYTGDIARSLVKDIQDAGGIITEQDLRDYQVEISDPLKISLSGGLTVLSPPPPGGGAVLSLILNIWDGYGLNASSVDGTDNQVLTYHRMLEAFKFAFARKTELGDPDFVDIEELVKKMTSKSFADSLRQQISDTMTHDWRYYDPVYHLPKDVGTTHVSVLGPGNDAVSVSSSINQYFGARFRSVSTGIILNDGMRDFSFPDMTVHHIPPCPANFIEPGKRPKSSMTPFIVLNSTGDVRLVLGAAGGVRCETASAYTTMHYLRFGTSLASAIELPRLHHSLKPNKIYTEVDRPFEPEEVFAGLTEIHRWKTSQDIAVLQGVVQEGASIFAHSDSRKDGHAAGF
ncbi:glutathione hydrolase 1 proenzyme-like [Branchiostoma floridae]|uniref:Glutathione hydrolase n=2 Tax=Branchiostoma floridae TaxID=7739 RepID=A0A9J7LWF1_BRAFL|nr:glutathione hydrolase 1 proenzyme-like [Branchiostoma floridae]